MTQHKALTDASPGRTHQSQPIPGSDQVPNSAGGFAWEVDVWQRVRRFLVLGVEGGTYYIGQQQLVTENVATLTEALKENGLKLVSEIVEVSDRGLAPSNDPALFALAYAAKKGDLKTRQAACNALPRVARIGTHLFHFADFIKHLGGWSRATRRAVSEWYNRDVQRVAYQAVKYRQRDGYSHRDLLRLAHVKPEDTEHDALFNYIVSEVNTTSGDHEHTKLNESLPEIVHGYETALKAETPAESAKAIRKFKLPREAVQTEHLNDLEVWKALNEDMPYTAMIRNLATMTRNGFLTATNDEAQKVMSKIVDQEAITKSRVHPIALLAALVTYQSGQSARGSATWTPIPKIVEKLDEAFYMAFENVEPTGRRIRLALDVSGSMNWGDVSGVPGLTPRVAAAAMAMVTIRTEDRYDVTAFTTGLTNLSLTKSRRLDDVLRATDRLPFGGTDCALPMVDALKKGLEFDAFLIFTDSETWAGRPHPAQALQEYRRKTGIPAKLIVVGMEGNSFSIADPNDPGMLDVVGMDTSMPNLLSAFIRDEI